MTITPYHAVITAASITVELSHHGTVVLAQENAVPRHGLVLIRKADISPLLFYFSCLSSKCK